MQAEVPENLFPAPSAAGADLSEEGAVHGARGEDGLGASRTLVGAAERKGIDNSFILPPRLLNI